MFGYVLVSNTNNVISFGGDDDFNDYLYNSVQGKTYFSPDCPSTSSGVCTDSSTESLSSVDGLKTSSQASRNNLSSTKVKASHLLLPLISMYRTYFARSGDRIESVVCSQNKILLRHLKCNYIVISIGNSEERQKRLLNFLEMGLELNIGPLLEFIDLKLMTVRLGSEFVESVSESCILENYKIREFLDVRKALFFQTELTFILPFLKSLPSKLLNTIGSNRCFLLSGGEVLASNTSDRKSIWDSITMSNLTLFFQLLSKRKYLKQYESVSLWLHSYKFATPIFTNAMIYNNGSGPILLCLSEAKYGSVISTIANLLPHLDNLAFSEHFTRDVRNIREMVEIISQGLHSIEANGAFTRKAGFMRSPSRTATFLQTIWQRTENLFKASCDKDLVRADHLWAVSSSLLSLKSAFSTTSLASPITPSTSIRNENFSIKCETMMKYFRRQVINILQELCFQTFEASKIKLAQFRETVSHMARVLPGNMISDQNIALALEKKSALLKDFMHPAALGLDMIAYSVSIPTKLITVDFIPDWISNEFNSLLRSLEDCGSVTSISFKSGKRYILYRVSESVPNMECDILMTRSERETGDWKALAKHKNNDKLSLIWVFCDFEVENISIIFQMNVERESPWSGFGLLKYLHVAIRSKMVAVAFFEEEIYKQLAERQVSRLLDIIANQISSEILFIS
ncbi:unnamed protein product [Angiostrongylus costaricensis]|uniref:Vacuolar fusion protein MON1 homolog n=1 Tax=Angiostrongylus costaricensis TaxID=334426 RepID=A0A0R3PTE3_ANGCS|nr:unnamed protein product [Angiostrongylus costaricensis]